MKKEKNNKSLIIIVCIIMISIIIIIAITEYNKTSRIEAEQMNEYVRQEDLKDCIETANNKRTSLWDNNCNKQANGKCTINNRDMIDWIEQRYEQELDNCYELYGN